MSEPVSKMAQANTLQTLPLELRLRIYEFVAAAARPTGPRLLIKGWLEKIDPEIDTTITPASVTLGQTFNVNGDLIDGDIDDDDDDSDEDVDDVIADEDEDEDDNDNDNDNDDADDGEDIDADDGADNELDDVDDDVRSDREKSQLNTLTHL
jgi:hypothetical protein